jgi:hypothetical protein
LTSPSEGLYRSQLSDWRRALAARGDEGLTPAKRGPKGKASPKETQLELRKRDRRIAALERKLAHAEILIDLQKKVAELAALSASSNGEELS